MCYTYKHMYIFFLAQDTMIIVDWALLFSCRESVLEEDKLSKLISRNLWLVNSDMI